MKKRTPWFNAIEHSPVRPGLYEFYDEAWGYIWMTYWDGKSWTWLLGNGGDLDEFDKWRGLAKPAK